MRAHNSIQGLIITYIYICNIYNIYIPLTLRFPLCTIVVVDSADRDWITNFFVLKQLSSRVTAITVLIGDVCIGGVTEGTGNRKRELTVRSLVTCI